MRELRTMRDVASVVRTNRRRLHWTQAQLAERLGVGRDWVIRLEQGATRLEVQTVLDALVVLGVPLTAGEAAPASKTDDDDPFADVFEALR